MTQPRYEHHITDTGLSDNKPIIVKFKDDITIPQESLDKWEAEGQDVSDQNQPNLDGLAFTNTNNDLPHEVWIRTVALDKGDEYTKGLLRHEITHVYEEYLKHVGVCVAGDGETTATVVELHGERIVDSARLIFEDVKEIISNERE